MIAEEIRCNPYVTSQTRAKTNNDQDLVTFNVPDEVAERAEVARLRTLEGVQHQQRIMHEDHWANGGVLLTAQRKMCCKKKADHENTLFPLSEKSHATCRRPRGVGVRITSGK